MKSHLSQITGFIISIFFLLLQSIIVYYTYNTYYIYIHFGLMFLFYFCIINLNILADYKISWLFLISILPIIGYGFFFYYLIIYKIYNKKLVYFNNVNEIKEIRFCDNEVVNYIYNISNFRYYSNTSLNFYSDVDLKNKDLFKDLRNATTSIYIEMYIISDGILFDEILDILLKKANDEIEIKIIVDAVGTKRINSKKFKILKKHKNVKVIRYGETILYSNPLINYRDHKKIIIIDKNIAYLGGDNFGDEYINRIRKFGFWRDNAIKVEGEAINSILFVFFQMWYVASNELIKIDYVSENKLPTNEYIIPFGDTPFLNKNVYYSMLKKLLYEAKEKVMISTPYFIIPNELKNIILDILKNNVQVFILIPNIPDKKSVYQITEASLIEIKKNGGKIYKYTKGFNHAKNLVIDDKYAIVGSLNMDYRSFFLNYEIGLFLAFHKEITVINDDFFKTIEESNQYEFKKETLFKNIIRKIMMIFKPMM